MRTVGLFAVVGTIVVALFVALLLWGTAREERADCLNWQQDADVYPAFFLAQWQKDQCDHYEIKINAPVWQPTQK